MNDWFFYALLSAVFSAAAAIGQKKALFKIDALRFSLALAFVNALLVLIYVGFTGFPAVGASESLILFGKTILGALAFWCVMISIKNFELSSILPVLVFTPALVALTAFIFLDEKLSAKEIAGMILMLTGIYILESKEKKLLLPLKELFVKSNSRFVLYALLLFTVSSVLDKLLIGKYKVAPVDFIILQQIFAFVVFLLIFLVESGTSKKSNNFTAGFSKNLLSLIILISLFTLTYRFLYIKSLQYGAVALSLTVKRFSVLFAVIASRQILKEGDTLRKTFATIFLIGGAYLLL